MSYIDYNAKYLKYKAKYLEMKGGNNSFLNWLGNLFTKKENNTSKQTNAAQNITPNVASNKPIPVVSLPIKVVEYVPLMPPNIDSNEINKCKQFLDSFQSITDTKHKSNLTDTVIYKCYGIPYIISNIKAKHNIELKEYEKDFFNAHKTPFKDLTNQDALENLNTISKIFNTINKKREIKNKLKETELMKILTENTIDFDTLYNEIKQILKQHKNKHT
jgi:hypothetical protein